jgi:hypothetical protein
MVCSFCKLEGHRCNSCPQKYKNFDENDLLNLKFEVFFKNILIYSLNKSERQIQANYEYLNKKYVVKNKFTSKGNENVLKVVICESSSARNSFDSDVDTSEENHTFFIILPTQYNKNEINLKNVLRSFEYIDESMMLTVEYSIKNLFWI